MGPCSLRIPSTAAFTSFNDSNGWMKARSKLPNWHDRQIFSLGYKQTIVVDDQNKSMANIAKEPLPRVIILAHKYADMLETGKFSTVIELAHHVKSDRSHVAQTLSLVNLAPDIIRAALEGNVPERLTLNKVLYGFPENWQEQRELFGIE